VPGGGQSANGAPATAFAAACLIGGLAWVFGVVLAYLALPLIAFVLARWRVEWAERRQERRS
jgi:Flp pilus assembly protein TadB